MRNYPKDYDYLGNSASASDCTGLIPAGTVEEVDLMNYENLYNFGGIPKMSYLEAQHSQRIPASDLYLVGYPQPPR